MGNFIKSMGGFLGFGNGQGEYYQGTTPPALFDPTQTGMYKELADRQGLSNNAGASNAIQNYGMGNGSLSDALSAGNGLDAAQQSQYRENLATDPLSGSRLATDQVQSNPILGQLFGKNGALSGALNNVNDLQTNGFKLQPEDYTAYGQTQDALARMFGQNEKGLANSLANRGLASSGDLAAREFSGLQGNKNEQLANAQMAIAQNRMQTNLQRLNSARQYAMGLGQQGENAIQSQYGRNLAGVENAQNNRNTQMSNINNGAYGLNSARANVYRTQASDAFNSAQNKQDNKILNFGDYLTAGLGQGIQSMGQQAPSAGMQMLGSQAGKGSLLAGLAG